MFYTLLPYLYAATSKVHVPLGPLGYVGAAVWAIGFATEAIADAQKSKFRSDPANKEKFISHGLWSVSRHPNYLVLRAPASLSSLPPPAASCLLFSSLVFVFP